MTSLMGKPIELRIKAIEAIQSGQPILKVATDIGVSVRTLRFWLKWFKQGGIENLKRQRPRAHKRLCPALEKQVFLLKEKNPNITLAQARAVLMNDGIKLTTEGIRKIWQRYGLIGFNKNSLTTTFPSGIPISREMAMAEREVLQIIEQKGNLKDAAHIINALACFPNQKILEKIPYSYLELRHKVEKLDLLFGKESIQHFYNRARHLRENLEKEGLIYSSLRAGLCEAQSLFWMGKHQETIALIEYLAPKFPKRGDPGLRFDFLNLKGIAYARRLMFRQGLKCLKECQSIIKTIPFSPFQISLANLCGSLGLFAQMRTYLEKAEMFFSNAQDTIRARFILTLASCLTTNGEYLTALKKIREIEKEKWFYHYGSLIPFVKAQCSLGLGRIEDAFYYIRTALETTKKKEIIQYLFVVTSVLAALYCSLGEKKKARSILGRLAPLLKKYDMLKDYYILKLLLGNIPITDEAMYDPLIRLVLLLKQTQKSRHLKDYNRVYKFTQNKGLVGYFHRLSLFFPEVVLDLLEKGKLTHLPKAILKLPIFNKKLPNFRIYFLGAVRIASREKFCKTKLRPKDGALLIHLSLARNHCLSLNEVYQNFWSEKKSQESNLSHLLWRLRKALGISNLYLFMKNENIYFKGYMTTDYHQFQESVAIAKALERAGAWDFAKREYLRAFRLFRGEPFRKMYDQWSEDMRHRILTQLEEESITFVRSCLEHGNKTDANRVLAKVLKIIPDSEEISSLLTSIQNQV